MPFRCLQRYVNIPLALLIILMPAVAVGMPRQERLVSVAFLGIAFTETQPDVEATIISDLLAMMRLEQGLVVSPPSQLRELIGRERLEKLLSALKNEEMFALADELGVEYIFAGRLANKSDDPQRTLLVGDFKRFDRTTRQSFTIEIARYYHDFGEELRRIHREFVLSIVPSTQSFWTRWPVLVIGGILVVGMVVLLLSPGKTTIEGQTPPPGGQEG